MKSDFEKHLEHSRAAYHFAIMSLPDPRKLTAEPLSVNNFHFTTEDQIESMLIELGWAFYCRYEACLENFIKEHKIPLNRRYTLEQWMRDNGIEIPSEFAGGLEIYRKVRNQLHHDDGQNTDDTEIHLYPQHMDKFYYLFIWIASAVAAKTGATQSG